MTAPCCLQQFFLMESLIAAVYCMTLLWPSHLRETTDCNDLWCRDGFVAVLTHGHQALTAACHDRAE